jgi:hypothetical protein
MSKYTTFKMTLDPEPGYEMSHDLPIYTVAVSFGGSYPAPVRCTGTSIRSAFDQATCYIDSLISHMCEECATQVEEYDETFRNCGMCQSCYDLMMQERGN